MNWPQKHTPRSHPAAPIIKSPPSLPPSMESDVELVTRILQSIGKSSSSAFAQLRQYAQDVRRNDVTAADSDVKHAVVGFVASFYKDPMKGHHALTSFIQELDGDDIKPFILPHLNEHLGIPRDMQNSYDAHDAFRLNARIEAHVMGLGITMSDDKKNGFDYYKELGKEVSDSGILDKPSTVVDAALAKFVADQLNKEGGQKLLNDLAANQGRSVYDAVLPYVKDEITRIQAKKTSEEGLRLRAGWAAAEASRATAESSVNRRQ